MLLSPGTRLTRQKLAEALTEEGFPTKPSTLATKATRGGGPPYELWGKKPIYTWGTSLAWATSRLSPPRTNSSEHCVVHSDPSECSVQKTAASVEDAGKASEAADAANARPPEATVLRPPSGCSSSSLPNRRERRAQTGPRAER
jgi:hypothetical protein